MISSLKKHSLIIVVLVFSLVGFAVAQVNGVPISLAPNPSGVAPSLIRTGALSVGTTAVPGTNIGLNVSGLTMVQHDYAGNPKTFNCGPTANNKCHSTYLTPGSSTTRTSYPEFLSTGSVNIAGQSGSVVTVTGKSGDGNIADPIQTFPTALSGVKLNIIAPTGTSLQGDPAASYMNVLNDSSQAVYAASCPANSPQPLSSCKKYACIESGAGNIISCANTTQANLVTPQRHQCSDGLDNDGDGKTDGEDLGCWSNGSYSQNGVRSCGSGSESASDNPTVTPC